jgi:PAS domain S-box-containing protein
MKSNPKVSYSLPDFNQALFEAITQGIIYQNTNGVILAANPAARKILGRTEDQLLGTTWIDSSWQAIHENGTAFSEADNPTLQALHTRQVVSGVIMGVHNPQTQSYSWIKITLYPQFENQGEPPSMVIATFEEAAEHKRTEKSTLLEREVWYRSLFDSMQEVFFVCEILRDDAGKPQDIRYLEANPACFLRANRKREEMVGHTYLELFPSNPTFDYWLTHFGQVALTGKFDHFEQFAEATGLYFEVYAYSPHPGQCAVLLNDITESKRKEKQIIQFTRLYATLSQINEMIVRVKERHDLFHSICNIAVEFGDFSAAWVGLLEGETGNVHPVAANGLDIAHWPFHTVNIHRGDMKDGLTAIAIRTSRVITSEDIKSDKKKQYIHDQIQEYKYHSVASVPFQLKGKTIGVLNLISGESGFFKAAEEITLLEEIGHDISFALDSIQIESEFKESEKLTRQWADAFENCAHGIAIGVPDANIILTCNPAFARMQGRSIEEISSMPILSMYPPQEHEQVIQAIAKADRTGSVQFEAHMMRKDGSLYPVQMDVVSVQDENGKIIYRVATQQNITERKQAEEALRLSEQTLQEAQTMALMGSWTADLQADTFRINPKSSLMVNWAPGNHKKEELLSLVHPDDRSILQKAIDGAMHGKPFDIEYRLIVNNEVKWQHVKAKIKFDQDGKPITALGVTQDISERKRAEEQINQLVERFDLAARAANLGVWDWDIVHNQMIWDDYMYALYGVKKEAVSAAYPVWLNSVHPADRAASEKISRQAQDGEKDYDTEFRIVWPDGSIHWIKANGQVIRDANGKALRMVGTNYDITQRKEAEEALRESEEIMRLFIEHAPASLAMFDLNMKYQAASLRWITDYHLDGQDILEKSHYEIFPEISKEWKAVHRRGMAGEVIRAEEDKFVRADGSLQWFRWEVRPWYHNNKVGGIVIFSEDITEFKLAETQLETQLKRIIALSEIDRAIISNIDVHVPLNVLLNEVISQLGVDAVSVLLLNSRSQTLEYTAGKGFRSKAIQQSRIRMGEGPTGKAVLEQKTLHITNLNQPDNQLLRAELLKNEEFVEYFAVPLITKGLLKGVVEIFNRTPLNVNADWVNYLETLGRQAAIAIDSAQLFAGLQQSNIELVTAYDATIAGWSRAMDLRDRETEGHTQRVTELTLKLAEKMGISYQEQIQIRRGALLHDIGKLGVPDNILLKPNLLTEAEWRIMRKHPTYAFEMLMPIIYLRPAIDIPYCHHEKWDGTGYPRGLKGEQIPLAARLFTFVDVWDALRSDRPYRPGWTAEKTQTYILGQSGRQFDPKIVDIFLDMVRDMSPL